MEDIKVVCLIYNLRNGIKQRGMLGRTLKRYWKDMDSTIRYSKKFI